LETQLVLIFVLIIGSLLFLMATGLPVALCFTLVTLIGAIVMWGYEAGLTLFIHNVYESISKFYLLPICMFILLGQVMFLSGMGFRMLDVMNKWLGRIPGRLALLCVVFSTLFATMSGSMMASASLMGTMLLPEMQKRGYSKEMSIGPSMGAGGLAMIIPPSGLAILLAAIGGISIGHLLIAGILPGLTMALLYVSYIVIRCGLQSSVAPAYDLSPSPLSQKIIDTIRYVLPLTLIIFLVLGLIFLGWTTPTEAAVLGAVGSLVLAAFYRTLNRQMISKSFLSTVKISGNILLILTGAVTFSQILAFSGATRQLAGLVSNLTLPPIMIIICMQLILLILGTFMDTGSMVMVTIPIFMPIIHALNVDPVWFGIIILINMEMSAVTPPVGLMLFVMKGVAPPGTTMMDVYKASVPFLMCDLTAMVLIMVFPSLALWLPNIMK